MKAVPANRYFAFFSIAITGCLVDLVSKRWAFDWLGMPGRRPTHWVWNNIAGFQTSLNEGALFGLGQGQVTLFAALSIAAAIGVLSWLFLAGAARDWLLTVALGCVTAGIFGNLYDRLGMPGLRWGPSNNLHAAGDPVYAVRDWVLVMIGEFHWPNFNVADALLVCGAGMLIWHAIFCGPPVEKTE